MQKKGLKISSTYLPFFFFFFNKTIITEKKDSKKIQVAKGTIKFKTKKKWQSEAAN